jgi:hypothetical protein
MIEKTFDDGTLGAALLDRYPRLEGVAGAFFSAFVSGASSGPLSVHWESLASQLDSTAHAAKLPGVREWAHASATKLRRMAREDEKREQEERLRR